MREMYELDQTIKRDLGEPTKTWPDYWNHMLKDGIWADQYFVQATALFLNMDIWIMDTTCTKKKPYFPVDGNLEDSEISTDVLYLGLAHESHYQSLLLNDQEEEKDEKEKDEQEMKDEKGNYRDGIEDEKKDENMNEDESSNEMEYKEEKNEENEDEEDNEIEYMGYTEENKDLEDEDEGEMASQEEMSDKDGALENNKCPICKKELKNVLLHVKRAKNCKFKISKEKIDELEARSKMIRKDKVKKNVQGK